MTQPSPLAGVSLASFCAGPVFLTAGVLTALYLMLPNPIEVDAGEVGGFLAMLPIAALVGTVLAFIPNLVGTLVLGRLAERHDFARPPVVWMLTGATVAAAAAILLMDGFGGGDLLAEAVPVAIPFAVTGAVCARICRAFAVAD